MRLSNDQRAEAVLLARFIDASEHEWPTAKDIPLLCNALIDEHNDLLDARARVAELEGQVEEARKALTQIAGPTFSPDEDWTCMICDQNAADDHEEDCPIFVAKAALAHPKGK